VPVNVQKARDKGVTRWRGRVVRLDGGGGGGGNFLGVGLRLGGRPRDAEPSERFTQSVSEVFRFMWREKQPVQVNGRIG